MEKQVLYHTGRGITVDEDGEQVPITLKPLFQQGSSNILSGVLRKLIKEFVGDIVEANATIHWETSRLSSGNAACAIICGKGGDDSAWEALGKRLRAVDDLLPFANHALSVRLFHRSGIISCENHPIALPGRTIDAHPYAQLPHSSTTSSRRVQNRQLLPFHVVTSPLNKPKTGITQCVSWLARHRHYTKQQPEPIPFRKQAEGCRLVP